jgi:hypothetical protein
MSSIRGSGFAIEITCARPDENGFREFDFSELAENRSPERPHFLNSRRAAPRRVEFAGRRIRKDRSRKSRNRMICSRFGVVIEDDLRCTLTPNDLQAVGQKTIY